MSLLGSPAADLWLGQFKDDEAKALATRLLHEFVFISANEFQRDLQALIDSKLRPPQTAAFYIERELKLVKPRWPYKRSDGRKVRFRASPRRIAEPMYPEVATARGKGLPLKWTAHGSALPAVKSPTSLQQDIGSEGTVATVVSKLCKVRKTRFALQPHTNDLIRGKAAYLAVVTDFIGSGQRSCSMLDSLWRIASVRSWRSSGYRKLLVIAYSGTEAGIEQVKRHPSRPEVHIVRKCPTIESSFSGPVARKILALCREYPHRSREPLGYRETGALIAFQHSCPNNVPAMFVESGRHENRVWQPLFPSRTTVGVELSEPADPKKRRAEVLAALKLGNIAQNAAFLASNSEQQDVITLLAAVYRGRRETADIVAASSLSYDTAISAFRSAHSQALLTTTGRLTAKGHALIADLNQKPAAARVARQSPNPYYYPSSLRVPL